jgi:hypothetical protein
MISKTKESEDRKDILICECYSTEHQMVIYYNNDDGRQCRFGAFDEFIFNPKDADKLQSVVNYLKENQ